MQVFIYISNFMFYAVGHKINERSNIVFNDNDIEENGKSSELLSLDFGVIAAATNDFSELNLLGKGGFGFVYKVCLRSNNLIERRNINFYRSIQFL